MTLLTSAGDRMSQIESFVGSNGHYYEKQFSRLEQALHYRWNFNVAAALLGPIWTAGRRLWVWAFIFATIELIVVGLLATGLYGPLGEAELARAQRLTQFAIARSAEAEQARQTKAADAASLAESAQALKAAAEEARQEADNATAGRPYLVMLGITLLGLARLAQGLVANLLLHRRLQDWMRDPRSHARFDRRVTITSGVVIIGLYGVSAFRFGSHTVPEWLTTFPTLSSWRDQSANAVGVALDAFTQFGSPFFVGIEHAIALLLNLMELLLITAPWPLVAFAILFIVVRRLGWRAAIWTGAGLAYLGALGFWEKSMQSVALLGAAAMICVAIGLPLGVWCGKSSRVYGVCRPVLDLMQTMPTFVYLIPVIAFFGIGKIPAIVATIFVGVPPLIRMAAVGVQTVPSTTREAVLAHGGSNWYVVWNVDLPLAAAAIKVGINQAVLTCLSMVVVASLIGAKGLGDDILHAINYADSGLGVLAGVAILICAMIMDRVAQGRLAGLEVR
jgi:glycine betaine/proline transport system permease protein